MIVDVTISQCTSISADFPGRLCFIVQGTDGASINIQPHQFVVLDADEDGLLRVRICRYLSEPVYLPQWEAKHR